MGGTEGIESEIAAYVAEQATPKPVMAPKKKGAKALKAVAHGAIEIKQPDGTMTTAEELVKKDQFFAEQPCVVSIGAKLKIGLPNYSSAECSVHISIPCAPAEINEVAAFAETWVDEKMKIAADKLEVAKKGG